MGSEDGAGVLWGVTIAVGGHRVHCAQDCLRAADLEREVKELRRANEILKLASAFFAQAELDRRLKS